jgi:chorismate mutase
MEESKNGKPMIEEALKELDQLISELSEEANKLKQKIFQVDLSDTTDVLKIFSRMEALCSELKGIKMTIMLQLDYIRDQEEYEKSLKV